MGVIQDFSIGASHGVGQRVSHAVSHEVSHGIGDHGVDLGFSHYKSVMSLVIEVVMGSVLELAYSMNIIHGHRTDRAANKFKYYSAPTF